MTFRYEGEGIQETLQPISCKGMIRRQNVESESGNVARTYTHTHTHSHTCTHAYTHTRVHTCTYIYTHTRTTHIGICTDTDTSTRTHTHTRAHTHTHTHAHTHTSIHAGTPPTPPHTVCSLRLFTDLFWGEAIVHP